MHKKGNTATNNKKRYIIPTEYPPAMLNLLRKEADKQGLPVSTYIRHLVMTHPKRKH